MKMRAILRTVLPTLALVLGVLAHAQISDNVVKIGVLTDLSGPYSKLGGRGSVIATNLAIEDCLQAECRGLKIEVLTADHQNKADIACSRAHECLGAGTVDTVPSSRGYAGGFAADLMLKDLGLALSVAVEADATVPLSALARKLSALQSAQAHRKQDFASIFQTLAPNSA